MVVGGPGTFRGVGGLHPLYHNQNQHKELPGGKPCTQQSRFRQTPINIISWFLSTLVSREFGVLLGQPSEVQVILCKLQASPHPFLVSWVEVNQAQCTGTGGRSPHRQAAGGQQEAGPASSPEDGSRRTSTQRKTGPRRASCGPLTIPTGILTGVVK